MSANANRVMICLAEAIPPTATGLVVWLRGGPTDVAVLTAAGAGFVSVAVIEGIRATLVKIAEVYEAQKIETEELNPPR